MLQNTRFVLACPLLIEIDFALLGRVVLARFQATPDLARGCQQVEPAFHSVYDHVSWLPAGDRTRLASNEMALEH
jgi:hypothetical protein